jgi:hypothetical protein
LTLSGYIIPVGKTLNFYLIGVAIPVATNVVINVAKNLTSPTLASTAIYFAALSNTPTVRIASKTINITEPQTTLTGPSSVASGSTFNLIIANKPATGIINIYLTGNTTPIVTNAVSGNNSVTAPLTGSTLIYFIALSTTPTVKISSFSINLLTTTLTGPQSVSKGETFNLIIANKPTTGTLNIYQNGTSTPIVTNAQGINSITAPLIGSSIVYYIALSTTPTIQIFSITINLLTPTLTGSQSVKQGSSVNLHIGNNFSSKLNIYLTGLSTPIAENTLSADYTFAAPLDGLSAIYYIAFNSSPTTIIASWTVILLPIPKIKGPSQGYVGQPATIIIENFASFQGTLQIYYDYSQNTILNVNTSRLEASAVASKEYFLPNKPGNILFSLVSIEDKTTRISSFLIEIDNAPQIDGMIYPIIVKYKAPFILTLPNYKLPTGKKLTIYSSSTQNGYYEEEKIYIKDENNSFLLFAPDPPAIINEQNQLTFKYYRIALLGYKNNFIDFTNCAFEA